MNSVPRSSLTRMPGAGAPVPQPTPTQIAPKTEVPCAHPRVQIVAREEDSEFVECLECREIFEASEFRDMAIEEKIHGSEDE